MPNLNSLADWAQIIAAFLAVIAIVVTVWDHIKSRRKRAIGYTVEAITSPTLLGAGQAARDNIEIRYKGQDTQNLVIMQARLKNTGNVSIRKSHVVEPVTFTLSPGAKFLDEPRVIYQMPQDLKVSWILPGSTSVSEPNAVSLDFELLNPKDQLLVEFVWTGPRAEPNVSARIDEGGIEPLAAEELRQWVELPSRILILLITLGLGAYLVYVLNESTRPGFVLGVIVGFLLSATIGYILTQFRVYRTLQGRRAQGDEVD